MAIFLKFRGRSIPYVLWAEGDSISDPAREHYLTNGTPMVTRPSFTYAGSIAVSGSKISGAVSRAATLDAKIPADKAGKLYVLYLFMGANDLSGVAGELDTFIAGMTSYLDARRAAGWDRVVVGAIIDRKASVTDQTLRDADALSANTTIRSWLGGRVNAIADFAANPAFTPGTGAADNTSYYNADKIHPVIGGENIMSPIWAAAIDGLA